jgi:hypothetical protein
MSRVRMTAADPKEERPMHARPTDPSYGYTEHLPGVPFDEARVRTVDALKNEGFGVPGGSSEAHDHHSAIAAGRT